MPSMIIRPFPDWNETLLRADIYDDFLYLLDGFWNETINRIKLFKSTEIDYPALTRLRSCIQRSISMENQTSDYNCPVIFDSWNCWDETQPGATREMSCPDFPDMGFSPNNSAYKTCTIQGEWWRHPETNMTWSNYTKCVDFQDLEFRNTVVTISLSGWSISLFFMAISLFIFFYFKSLDCGRIKMHKNLFISMSGNNIFWIVWYSCVQFQHEVWSKNPVWCRVLEVTKTYFMISTYSWMLCEGTYLQLLLMNTWGVKRWQLCCLIASGWGLPLLVIIPYSVFRSNSAKENENCWMDSGESIWFLAVPVIMAISFNVLIVINVILLIKRNRNVQSEDSQVAGGPNSAASTLKAARAALMLIPILGIHFLLMPIRPEQGTTLEYFYEVFAAVSSSYQGFFVSIIFCFMNSDVLEILKKKCRRRSEEFFRTQATTLQTPISNNVSANKIKDIIEREKSNPNMKGRSANENLRLLPQGNEVLKTAALSTSVIKASDEAITAL